MPNFSLKTSSIYILLYIISQPYINAAHLRFRSNLNYQLQESPPNSEKHITIDMLYLTMS